MSDKKHAELLSKFMDWKKKYYKKGKTKGKKKIVKCLTEVPYNYYGDRGFVDLVFRTRNEYDDGMFLRYITLYELKTDLDDIGRAIRQVKKQKRYFPKDRKDLLPDVNRENYSIHSHLVISFKRENWRNYLDTLSLFNFDDVFTSAYFFDKDKPCRISYSRKTETWIFNNLSSGYSKDTDFDILNNCDMNELENQIKKTSK